MIAYTERAISLPNQTLYYYKAGSGSAALIAFHGFGQDHHAFDLWCSRLANKYTLYLVDLPFHGKSTWQDSTSPLRKPDWQKVLTALSEQENISTFSLAGFSLGGKFALASLEAFPQATQELFLIAPDGLAPNFWYSLATYPLLFRKVFRGMIRHQGRFAALTTMAKHLRLADNWILRFAENQMNTVDKRARVYNTWVVFRHLRFDPDQVKRLIEENRVRVAVFAGKYDRVIPPAKLKPQLNRLNHVSFHVLDCGHNSLVNEVVRFL